MTWMLEVLKVIDHPKIAQFSPLGVLIFLSKTILLK